MHRQTYRIWTPSNLAVTLTLTARSEKQRPLQMLHIMGQWYPTVLRLSVLGHADVCSALTSLRLQVYHFHSNEYTYHYE